MFHKHIPRIAPSLLAADLARIADELAKIEQAGCSYVHLDVMDGHFVPNITFGPIVIEAMRKQSTLIFDTHLMISKPWEYIESFASAGSDMITIHLEAHKDHRHLGETLQMIRANGKKTGVALNPSTALSAIEPLIEYCDMLLIMSVVPGFGGQTFISESEKKLQEARSLISKGKVLLSVDGGINLSTLKKILPAEPDIIVAGSALFQQPDGFIEAYTKFQKHISEFYHEKNMNNQD